MSGKGRFQRFPPSPREDSSMKNKVEVQKGRMDPNMPTIRHMTHSQRLRDREEEVRMTRRGQDLEYHEPKM
jgi:hypothetical protein